MSAIDVAVKQRSLNSCHSADAPRFNGINKESITDRQEHIINVGHNEHLCLIEGRLRIRDC